MSGTFSRVKRHLPLLLILLFATPPNPVAAQPISPITQPISPITQPVPAITQPVAQPVAATQQDEGDREGNSQEENPLYKKVQQEAEQEVRDAQQKLDDAKQSESIKDQQKAEQELDQAGARLKELTEASEKVQDAQQKLDETKQSGSLEAQEKAQQEYDKAKAELKAWIEAYEWEKTLQGRLNKKLEAVVEFMGGVLFYEVPLFIKKETKQVVLEEDHTVASLAKKYSTSKGDLRTLNPGLDENIKKGEKITVQLYHKAALVLLVLIFGGIFFTIRFRFINLRLFTHSINVIRGKYDKPEDEGEITHFQALTSALSATVGLGNIGGVAIAIAMGGPGAVFWMWCIAFFGMSAKFTSCSFAQLYRRVKPDGTVLGGPMVYLDEGIKEHYPNLAWLGKTFGIAFAIFTIGASFGGGNMFQGNQTFQMLNKSFGIPQSYDWLVGIIMAALVAVVIIGGIKRIGEVTSKMVPAMCLFYCTVCLIIILNNASQVPAMITSIFVSAFQPDAIFSGGMIGVLLMGARRAAFSNEAGLGSAAIAHAAARTEEPIREGVVAMIGPFIDTIVVCTMTALTILITNAHIDLETGQPFVEELAKQKDVELTAIAFASLRSWLPYLLSIAVCVFAYSTMISWSYYGERSAEFLVGERGILPYRVLFVGFVVLGPILTLETVIGFSDMMLFSMAFPNIIGLIMLSGALRGKAKDYVARLKSGEISRTD